MLGHEYDSVSVHTFVEVRGMYTCMCILCVKEEVITYSFLSLILQKLEQSISWTRKQKSQESWPVSCYVAGLARGLELEIKVLYIFCDIL